MSYDTLPASLDRTPQSWLWLAPRRSGSGRRGPVGTPAVQSASMTSLTAPIPIRAPHPEVRDTTWTPSLGRRLGQIASDQAVRRMLRPAPQAGLR